MKINQQFLKVIIKLWDSDIFFLACLFVFAMMCGLLFGCFML